MPKFLTSIDMVQNEIKNLKIQSLGSAPLSPVEGQMYFNTTDIAIYIFLGGVWKDISSPDVTKAELASVTSGSSGAGLIGTSNISGINGSNVQTVLENLKSYVDSVKQSLDIKDSVKVATTATEANLDIDNAPLTIDSITLNVGDRVLVKDNAYSSVAGELNGSDIRNGIYEVALIKDTNADSVNDSVELVRAVDASTNEQVTSGMFTFVESGTENADAGFVLSTNGAITLGTSALIFTQFSGAGQITAGNGLVKSGNKIDVAGTAGRIVANADSIDIDPIYAGQASINTVGTITTGTWNGNAIPVANGGTGATTSSGARANIGATTKFSQDIGDGTSTSYLVAHNFGTQDVIVMVREASTPFNVVSADIQVTDANSVTVNFGTAPSANQYRVTIVG